MKYTYYLLTVLFFCLSGCSVEKAIVSYGTTGIKVEDHLSIGDFMFDTGATNSAIFDDAQNLSNEKSTSESVYDINRVRKEQNMYTVDNIQLGNISVKNAVFVHIPRNDLPPYMDKFNGLVGMNVINKANWFFDTKKNQVTVYPKDTKVEIPSNAFVMNYRTTNVHPVTSLKIEDKLFRNVRIDFGSYQTINLNSNDITAINKTLMENYLRSDSISSVSLFDDKIINVVHEYNDVEINDDFIFNSLKIYENEREDGVRRIGFGFFNYFNYIYMNTKEQKIYLYN